MDNSAEVVLPVLLAPGLFYAYGLPKPGYLYVSYAATSMDHFHDY